MASETAEPNRPDEIKAIPVRRPGRWIAAAMILVFAAALVKSVVTNPRFKWGIIGHYFTSSRVLQGLITTLEMTRLQTMRRFVLPQAMRVIVPPTGNETISMLKTTSLVSVIAVTDLLYSVELIYAVNYRTIPLLIVASIWYLIVTTVLSFGQYYVERYFGRGAARELPPTPLQRLRRNVLMRHGN